MVEFTDSEVIGFMPRRHSGFKLLDIGETIQVVIIDISDKPIVSLKEAKKKLQNDIYAAKVNLLKKAKPLLEMADVESAIKSYQELRAKWDEIGHTRREEELWPEFKEVEKQLYSKNRDLQRLQRLIKELDAEKKRSDIYAAKVNLLKKARSLLEMADVESAIKSYQELRKKWYGIGYPRREELWPEFKEVEEQLYSKKNDLKQLIFSQIERGHVFKGTIVNIVPKGILVKLEGQNIEIIGFVPKEEISWNYFPNINDVVEVGNEIKVVVLKVDQENFSLILGMKQLELLAVNKDESEKEANTEYVLTIKKLKYPGLIITEGFDKYSLGVILPNNITLNGAPISASARWDLVNGLYQKGSLEYALEGAEYIGHSLDNNIAFFKLNILSSENLPDNVIKIGEISDVEVINKCNSYIQIKSKEERLAYINTSEFKGDIPKVGTTIKARLIEIGDNILQYSKYSILDIDDKMYDPVKSVISEDGRLSEIFEDEEIEELQKRPDEIVELKQILDDFPDLIHKKNREELTMELRVKATQDMELYRGRFFDARPDYFVGKTLKVYFDDNRNYLYLWDSREVLVVIGERDGYLYLENLYDERQHKRVHHDILRNKRASSLLIDGSKLTIFPYLSSEQLSAERECFGKIQAIQFINRLKYDLQKQVGNVIRSKTELYT